MGYRPEPPVPGLVQVGAQVPPTRRSARLARVASSARGSLLCTTRTSHLGPSLGAVKSQTGVRFSLSQRVHFRTSLDTARMSYFPASSTGGASRRDKALAAAPSHYRLAVVLGRGLERHWPAPGRAPAHQHRRIAVVSEA